MVGMRAFTLSCSSFSVYVRTFLTGGVVVGVGEGVVGGGVGVGVRVGWGGGGGNGEDAGVG